MDNANVDVISPEDTTSVATRGSEGPPSFPPPPLPTEKPSSHIGLNSTSEAFIDNKDTTHELDKGDRKNENDSSALPYNKKGISTTNSGMDHGLR